jgi:hypothetical protein
MFEIICFGLIVPLRCYRFVSEYKTKRNNNDVFVGGYRADNRRSNEEQEEASKAAALFALNSSAAFFRVQKARKYLGNVESKPMFHL